MARSDNHCTAKHVAAAGDHIIRAFGKYCCRPFARAGRSRDRVPREHQ
jgi:hypothetical protein